MAGVEFLAGERYPWRAACAACGWTSPRGYVASHAAQIWADSHACAAPCPFPEEG